MLTTYAPLLEVHVRDKKVTSPAINVGCEICFLHSYLIGEATEPLRLLNFIFFSSKGLLR